jgi:hypothetical protein
MFTDARKIHEKDWFQRIREKKAGDFGTLLKDNVIIQAIV